MSFRMSRCPPGCSRVPHPGMLWCPPGCTSIPGTWGHGCCAAAGEGVRAPGVPGLGAREGRGAGGGHASCLSHTRRRGWDSLTWGQLRPGGLSREARVRDVVLGEAGTSPEQAKASWELPRPSNTHRGQQPWAAPGQPPARGALWGGGCTQTGGPTGWAHGHSVHPRVPALRLCTPGSGHPVAPGSQPRSTGRSHRSAAQAGRGGKWLKGRDGATHRPRFTKPVPSSIHYTQGSGLGERPGCCSSHRAPWQPPRGRPRPKIWAGLRGCNPRQLQTGPPARLRVQTPRCSAQFWL